LSTHWGQGFKASLDNALVWPLDWS